MGVIPYSEPIADTMRLIGHEPESVEATCLPMSLLANLALKMLYLTGELTLADLGKRMQLHPCVIYQIFEYSRKAQLIEVTGMDGGIYRVATTTKGKAERVSKPTR